MLNYTSYLNNSTINYSTLNTTGLNNYRYVTFAWKVNTSGLTPVGNKNIQFTLNNYSSSLPSSINSNSGTLSFGSYNPLLYYRVEDATNTSTINNFSGEISTPWINGNNYNNSTQISSANFSSIFTNYTGLLNNTGISISGSTITFNVILGNALTNSITSSSVYIYCRLAIPISLSFSFQNISCNLN